MHAIVVTQYDKKLTVQWTKDKSSAPLTFGQQLPEPLPTHLLSSNSFVGIAISELTDHEQKIMWYAP